MRLSKLELRNWMAFRGHTSLELEAKLYGVVARREGDPERSNWLGKSSLLEGIFFALTGQLNPDRHMGADGWVTDGEKDGEVILHFDDGSVVERRRRRATELFVHPRDGRPAKNAEAQKMLDEMIGLTADDMLATCYFQQRKMARLVLEKPKDRMEIVSAWFRLGPLEAAYDKVSSALTALVWEQGVARTKLDALKHTEERELGPNGGMESLEVQINDYEDRLHTARARRDDLQAKRDRFWQVQKHQQTVKDYEHAATEAVRLRKELEMFGPEEPYKRAVVEAEVALAHLQQLRGVADADARGKRLLARGQFDGRCPVAEVKCPIRADIVSAQMRNQELEKAAEEELRKATAETMAARQAVDVARGRQESFARARALWEAAQRRASDLFDAYGAAVAAIPEEGANPEEIGERLREANQEVENLVGALNALRRSYSLVSEARREQMAVNKTIDELEEKIATHREAALIFGKNGAQRRVAEDALAAIEAGANAMLTECGIGLEVFVQWAREGGGLAKACDTCGHPFPESRAEKACKVCGAARGPNMINRLDVVLSDQSGAAEDLVGAALQLSASAWLRNRRASGWSLALLDEPFGQLDGAHRRAFASHLTTMLGGRYGFEQAMVIAHHSSVLDSLPGRIEIVNDGRWSKARVVA